MKHFSYTEKKETRKGFGDALLELGHKNKDIVGLCADLTGSVRMDKFADAFPDRFFQVGIAEANMIGISAGMALSGKIPICSTFANFATARVYDQIRQSVAYSNTNVKICASHAGLSLGEDGATHQTLEDIGLMKMLPNMTVINPCDYHQTIAATKAIIDHKGPVYLRFGRPSVPVLTTPDQEFIIGKANTFTEGSDVSIFVTGHLVWECLEAAMKLSEIGIDAEVINLHTIKPLDREAVINSVSKTHCAVSVEEHFLNGGLGDSIAQLLVMEKPVPMEMVGVDDQFGESGTPDQLLKKYGLNSDAVIEAVKKVIERKKA